jgi:lipopolysaccharide/colanic/teichoic acid biosynthesis glycosyltransferase
VRRSHHIYDVFKRGLDLIAALSLLVVLAPVLLAVGLFVRVRLGRPVLFAQTRPGRGGRLFTLYKFRTMAPSGELHGVAATETDAARLSGFGRALRSTSLDELPELWNVVRGDMSVVGPRPLLPEYLERYNDEQARRHEVRPGITGWAQVNGRNAVDWEDRFAMDVWYVDNRSFLLDARILLKTVVTVFQHEGVSASDHVTSRPFDPEREPNGDEPL